jgi:hypothetical protein
MREKRALEDVALSSEMHKERMNGEVSEWQLTTVLLV